MEGLIGVFIGGAISFLSGYFMEDRKNKKEVKKLKNERLEKLFYNYLKWESVFTNIYYIHARYQQNKLTLDQLDKQIERIIERDKDIIFQSKLYKYLYLTKNLKFNIIHLRLSKVYNYGSDYPSVYI